MSGIREIKREKNKERLRRKLMKKLNKLLYIGFIVIMLSPLYAHAFDDWDTHPRYTDGAISNSITKSYFKNLFGYSDIRYDALPYLNHGISMKGYDETALKPCDPEEFKDCKDASCKEITNPAAEIKGTCRMWPIIDLLKGGSQNEDTPDCRAIL